MLTAVRVTNVQGDSLEFPFQDVANGYVIQSIEGLDPVKANVVSSSMAKIDGEEYESSRREKRNIVIKMGLEPDHTNMSVRGLRTQLYDYFMPKATSLLTFVDDELGEVDIIGMTETLDAPLFTEDPEATISILCFDPDFYYPDQYQVDGVTTSGDIPLLIPYEGTVDTGFVFELRVDRTIADFTIYCGLSGMETTEMPFIASLVAGDIVTVSTVQGDKYVRLQKGSAAPYSILYAKDPASDWSRLNKGMNEFRVYTSGAAIPWTITYTTKFGAL